MREFRQYYLFKITVEPDRGYHQSENRRKPYYVVAANKDLASQRINLRDGWKVAKVSMLGEQLSETLFGGGG